MKTKVLTAALAGFVSLAATAELRDFWTYETSEWGQGEYVPDPRATKKVCQSWKVGYTVDVAETGWHRAVCTGGHPLDLVVDGRLVWRSRRPVRKVPSDKGEPAALGNLWLEKGRHQVTFQRLGRCGFPNGAFGGFEFVKSAGDAEDTVDVKKGLVDVIRTTDKLEVVVTGGGTDRAYELEFLYRPETEKLPGPRDPRPAWMDKVVGTVSFAAGAKPETKTVWLPAPAEGAYVLHLREKGAANLLRGNACAFGTFAAVDTSAYVKGSGREQVLHVIDCVAQTIDGRPLATNAFTEANGPTRVVRRNGLAYRETHDSSAPLAHGLDAGGVFARKNASGMAYVFPVPAPDKPLVIDIEFPDDSRRNVAFTGFGGYGGSGGAGYETGFTFPISNTMKSLRIIAWPQTDTMEDGCVRLGMFATQYGTTAAASKITVSRFEDDLVPVEKLAKRGGREYGLWWEEGGTWPNIVGIPRNRNVSVWMRAVDRFARLARYYGCTGLSLPGISYDSVFCRTDRYPGAFCEDEFDLIRLEALYAERYGMSVFPELFPCQVYERFVYLPSLVKNRHDVRATDAYGCEIGAEIGGGGTNPLHPVVQQFWIDLLGEMADKLRDSPAFRGLQNRADSWRFSGSFLFTGIEQGYDDWSVALYEKETGDRLGVDPAAKDRFLQRFLKLSAPDRADRWFGWRAEKILDFHRRIRARLAGDRDDVIWATSGSFTVSDYSPKGLTARLRALGIDKDKYLATPGLAIFPASRYGKNEATVAKKISQDVMEDPEFINCGKGVYPGYGFYFDYQEYGRDIPQDALGFKTKNRFWYCAATNGGGRDTLKKFAGVLGEQDMIYARDGGDNNPFGDHVSNREWFGAFAKIPAVRMDDVAGLSDPVAVRQVTLEKPHYDFAPATYYYLVNREEYPVVTHLDFSDGSKQVVALRPYELVVGEKPVSVRITGGETEVPPGTLDALKSKLAFAQNVWEQLEAGKKAAFTADELADYKRDLDAAWQAFREGRLWRARTAVEMGHLYNVFMTLGCVPEWIARVPNAAELKSVINPKWTPEFPVEKLEVVSKGGAASFELDVRAEGVYTLEVGYRGAAKGTILASLDGAALPGAMAVDAAGVPLRYAFAGLKLLPGKHTVAFVQPGGSFSLYAYRLAPRLRAVPGRLWKSCGPFAPVLPPNWDGKGRPNYEDQLKAIFEKKYVPDGIVDRNAEYATGFGDQKVRWQSPDYPSNEYFDHPILNLLARCGRQGARITYYGAVTIRSDRDRTAQVSIGGDWECWAWLNGEYIVPDKAHGQGGAPWGSWRVLPVGAVSLRKGDNLLFVRNVDGSLGNGLKLYVTDDPGIEIVRE